MSNADPIVIVGGGQAAGQLADSLRREGYAGAVTVLCDEPMPPYQRPHLSKLYLAGILDHEKLLYRPRDFYAERGITVMSGQRATRIDAAARSRELVFYAGARVDALERRTLDTCRPSLTVETLRSRHERESCGLEKRSLSHPMATSHSGDRGLSL
jgi:NADPH-dependent 2,4-dienoyl-CoA reductase/sulfur reductase-like enzyme